jgi:alanine racemase
VNATINYSLDEIVKFTGGKLINHNDRLPPPHTLSLDSRKIISPSATIFFAITTYGNDGNNFIEGLYAKGVRNFVTSNLQTDLTKIPFANVIQVDNVITALQRLAIHHRKKFLALTVIGITGSNGKTIVKEWLNQLLEPTFTIVRSPKSYNSQIGVPLSILQINETYTLGIFEAGISQPGEMEKLEKIIEPSIGIFTNIGQAHDEGFENRKQKIEEKLRLFINAKRLIFCGDDGAIKKSMHAFQKQILKRKNNLELFSWGRGSDNKLQIVAIHKKKTYSKIDAISNGKNISVSIPFTDDASIENAISCWCTLLLLDKDNPATRKRFELLYPIAMRLELKDGINNCTIINDSYSNDIHSLSIALNFVEQQKQHKNNTVILSDILQSGIEPKKLYGEVANVISHKKIKRIIGIGADISSQKKQFLFLKDAQFFLTVDDFLKSFEALNFHDETILIKGARNFGFEKISHKLEHKIHHTLLSINLNAIAHNLKHYRAMLKPSTKIMAMVKAFSYGSGGHEIASVLEFNKVNYLAVAYTDEGVELRNAGISLPIMVMNAETDTFDALINNNLEPEIFSLNILNDFQNFLKSNAVDHYPVHIKIDSGMHRLGFTNEERNALCTILLNNTSLKIVSAFTHLVAAESEKEDNFTFYQAKIFQQYCTQLEACLGYKFIKHISNTAGISRHPQLQMDMVRLGIGLYGIDSSKKVRPGLQNVTTLSTTISQIKNVKAGETIGYGRNAKIKRDSRIATVRIGYADGYPRNLSNGIGKMIIQGKLVPVVGNVCMDMTMLDVTEVDNIHEGDEVIVFGSALPIDQLAAWSQTIPYEIMTGISQRVKRIYFEE